ncbi:hypothetical protein EV356DRAFT_504455 [Viridothelium virens]|uniref:Uncharacterized protein n=1 Tax=Viridothelium virens TaxID=1048519 RepID=A0A6A6H633_VIRVR|nr:hypothetical protein EV356DRAFT_504455 [Viridothelium virens]
MKTLLDWPYASIIFSFLVDGLYAQLGISGTESEICSSSCNIAAECAAQCLNQPTGSPYISCLCQESCVDFFGICDSCCQGTASSYGQFQDPFCGSSVNKNLQNCNFYGDVAPNAKAYLFNSISFASSSSLPSNAASFVSRLPSPTLVTLNVTSSQVTASTTVSAPCTTWGGPPKISAVSSAAANPTSSSSTSPGPTATPASSAGHLVWVSSLQTQIVCFSAVLFTVMIMFQ